MSAQFQLVEWNGALGTARPILVPFDEYATAESAARSRVFGKRSFYYVSVHPIGRPISRSAALFIVGGDK